MKFRCEYKYSRPFGNPKHMWTLVGRCGGVHFHVTEHFHLTEVERMQTEVRFSGGIECHYRTPPEYMENDAPSHDDCFLLKTPCWHDGSSLQAEREWIPFWRQDPHNHEAIFKKLEQAYYDHLDKDQTRCQK